MKVVRFDLRMLFIRCKNDNNTYHEIFHQNCEKISSRIPLSSTMLEISKTKDLSTNLCHFNVGKH